MGIPSHTSVVKGAHVPVWGQVGSTFQPQPLSTGPGARSVSSCARGQRGTARNLLGVSWNLHLSSDSTFHSVRGPIVKESLELGVPQSRPENIAGVCVNTYAYVHTPAYIPMCVSMHA